MCAVYTESRVLDLRWITSDVCRDVSLVVPVSAQQRKIMTMDVVKRLTCSLVDRQW